MADLMMEPTNTPKVIKNAINGQINIRVRQVSSNVNLFKALQVLEENKLPLLHYNVLYNLFINTDGSKNKCMFNAIQSEYQISDLWCGPIFAHEAPNTPLGEVIESEYPNGEKRRILTLKEIRGQANLIQTYPKDRILIPGEDFTYKMKNGVLEFEFNPKDLIAHELPLEQGEYVGATNNKYPTNLLTGLPDPNGRGPKRRAWLCGRNSAIGALNFWLDKDDGVGLYLGKEYSDRGILDITPKISDK